MKNAKVYVNVVNGLPETSLADLVVKLQRHIGLSVLAVQKPDTPALVCSEDKFHPLPETGVVEDERECIVKAPESNVAEKEALPKSGTIEGSNCTRREQLSVSDITKPDGAGQLRERPSGTMTCTLCGGKGFVTPCQMCLLSGGIRAPAVRGSKFFFCNKLLRVEDIVDESRFIEEYCRAIKDCLGIHRNRIAIVSMFDGVRCLAIETFIEGSDGVNLAGLLGDQVLNNNSTFFDTRFARDVCRFRKCSISEIVEVGARESHTVSLAFAENGFKVYVERKGLNGGVPQVFILGN